MSRPKSCEVCLSPTERDLLSVLVFEAGEWCSRDHLVEAVYGERWFWREPTRGLIAVHVHNIRRKLGPGATRLQSRLGRGYGYRWAS